MLKSVRRSSKTVGVLSEFFGMALNQRQPTQMAIPLQMESVPKQLVAAMWRA